MKSVKHSGILVVMAAIAACGSSDSRKPALPSVTMLSPDSANHSFARFSPDGTRIFWWEPAAQGNVLWTADAKLSNPARVPVMALQTTSLIWSPDGSQLAVPSSSSGYVQVGVIPAGGGPPRALTDVMFAIPVSWHPDGDRVIYGAYAGDKGGGTLRSFVTSLSRGGHVPLIPSESRPAFGRWTPDGSRIVYMAIDGSRSTIWIADSTGQNPRQLTTDGFETLGAPGGLFSPDGKEVVYESRRTGTSDVWILPIAGGPARQLTRDIRNDTSPMWSPDGQWIAFISERGKQTDIWVVPAAGGQEIRVTDDAIVEELMQWRDKSTLAFLTGEGQSGIWAVTLADSSERRLTPDSLRITEPNPSPDGKQMVVRIERGGGNNDLAVMPVSGGAMRLLVQGGDNSRTTWSPDGTTLAFMSDRGGTFDIWVVSIAGGEPRQLTNWPGLERSPAWSGDGTTLYFVADKDARLGDVWRVPPAGGEPVRVTNAGAMNGLVTHYGRPEVFASLVNGTGNLVTVQLRPDGTIMPIAHGERAIPIDLIADTDSLVIGTIGTGGRLGYRIIPLKGSGDGVGLLQSGENLSWVFDELGVVLYKFTNGSTSDIGLLYRKTGTTRRVTNNSVDEGSAWINHDGKTVNFLRSRPVRRIAIADLSKLLVSAPKQ